MKRAFVILMILGLAVSPLVASQLDTPLEQPAKSASTPHHAVAKHHKKQVKKHAKRLAKKQEKRAAKKQRRKVAA